MRFQTFLVLILAVVCGGAAVIVVMGILQERGSKSDTVPVLVALAEIPPFAVIAPGMVEVKEWPKDRVPAGALTKAEDAVERAVLNPLVKNEVVLDAKLAPRGADRGMATKIPKGMRAFTIHTPTIEAGVAGFILPGNRVDVLLTLERLNQREPERDLTGGATTAMLLQDVEILAIEQRVVAPAESKVAPDQLKSVTLLVTPQQAASLTLGQNKGKLCLALRNYGDDDMAATRPVHVSNLLGEQLAAQLADKPKPAVEARPAPPPPPLQIRTVRGTQEGAVLIQAGSVTLAPR
jgi:pilus assembly protein CpaB